MSTVEILEELSSKIAEVYDLELAEELTEIYENLADHIYGDTDEYFELTKKLAEMEIKKDKYKEEYKRVKEAFEFAREAYKKLFKLREGDANYLSEERDARRQAESEVEWLKRELEEERRLRVDAEYDKEYYAMQLMEHID